MRQSPELSPVGQKRHQIRAFFIQTNQALDLNKCLICHECWPYLDYEKIPNSVVADGCYASQENVKLAKALGVKRNAFSKPVGLTLGDMGVKKKTFDALRHFRAGVEGNISEIKRAFCAGKATWKGHDGFKAFVWSSVLSYNLIRLVRFSSA